MDFLHPTLSAWLKPIRVCQRALNRRKNEKGEMDDLLKLIVEQLTKTQEQFIIPTILEKTGEYLNMNDFEF